MPRAVDMDSAEDRLRRLETVTDSNLAHLRIEEVLQELLNRVRSNLDADTATILLLDDTGRQLVVAAASGIEEEVRQGVRIRVGEGFAGRIAAELKPHVIDRVDADTVVNPLLWERGIRTLVGVPLLAEGEPVGILHVGTLQQRSFDEEDIEWLRAAADRIAVSLRSRQTNTERATADTLQRSLVAAQLPDISGLDLASRYVPAEVLGVSGDWYDVFALPSGRVCMVIGDVVERGLPAAMVMARLRTALRSYALDTDDPAEVLAKLDRHVRHFEVDSMATIACGIWEPSLERVRLSLAGHLVPLLAVPDERSRLISETMVDAPIGVSSAPQSRTAVTVEVPHGATVFFYTDGLVERRHRSLDEGLQQLRDAIRPGPADALCAEVMNRLVGMDPPSDDIAVLAVRRVLREAPTVVNLEVDALPDSLAEIRSELRLWLPSMGASDDDVADLLIAVGEAVANSIEHAYGPRGGKVKIRMAAEDGEVTITVSDAGRWRAPRGTHRGRGTELMRQLCDELTIEQNEAGTHVRLRKRLSEGETG